MKKYIVRLTQVQRQDLHHLISTGEEAARKLLHARMRLSSCSVNLGLHPDPGPIPSPAIPSSVNRSR